MVPLVQIVLMVRIILMAQMAGPAWVKYWCSVDGHLEKSLSGLSAYHERSSRALVVFGVESFPLRSTWQQERVPIFEPEQPGGWSGSAC
jgi:hypothetical protein